MVPERPPLEIASAVNKVFMVEVERAAAEARAGFDGMAPRSAAQQEHDYDDGEQQADRAAANPNGTGKNGRD